MPAASWTSAGAVSRAQSPGLSTWPTFLLAWWLASKSACQRNWKSLMPIAWKLAHLPSHAASDVQEPR